MTVSELFPLTVYHSPLINENDSILHKICLMSKPQFGYANCVCAHAQSARFKDST